MEFGFVVFKKEAEEAEEEEVAEAETVCKWIQLSTFTTFYPGMLILSSFIRVDYELPNELFSSLKKLNSSLTTLENESKSDYEMIQKEFELYKKRSKAATSLLQEKNKSMTNQIDCLQQEVFESVSMNDNNNNNNIDSITSGKG